MNRPLKSALSKKVPLERQFHRGTSKTNHEVIISWKNKNGNQP
nr:MAG TPA: hypothetical protein [Caudoviricetes sp.]